MKRKKRYGYRAKHKSLLKDTQRINNLKTSSEAVLNYVKALLYLVVIAIIIGIVIFSKFYLIPKDAIKLLLSSLCHLIP